MCARARTPNWALREKNRFIFVRATMTPHKSEKKMRKAEKKTSPSISARSAIYDTQLDHEGSVSAGNPLTPPREIPQFRHREISVGRPVCVCMCTCAVSRYEFRFCA